MKSLAKSSIILIFLLECSFFYLIPMPKIITKYNNYGNKFIIFSIIMLMFLLMFLKKKSFRIIKQCKFNEIIVFFIYMFISEIILSYMNYHQSLKDILSASYYFLIILYYYIIMYYISQTRNIEFIKKIIILFSLLLSIIFIIQAIIYNSGGNLFLNIPEFDLTKIPIRGDKIRLTHASTLISFGVILSFAEIIRYKETTKGSRILNIFNLFFSMYYLIYVNQTRAVIICELLSFILMLLFKTSKSFLKKTVVIMVTILGILIISNISITEEFIASFSDPANEISNTYRMEEISFYVQQAKDNIFFGRGFVNPVEGQDTFDLLHGYQGYLYTTDVGIIGFLSTLGGIGVLWYIIILIKLFYMLFRLSKNKEMINYIELLGIITFLISTSTTLIVLDPQRIILLPIIMAFFEYYYIIYKQQNKINIKEHNLIE